MARKRSYEVPLLWIGAAALIGFPLVRDATADRMLRDRYADPASCRCDYGSTCESNDDGDWVGPWYPEGQRDPRAGSCSTASTSGGYYGGYGYGYGYRAPVGVERGYRGGFGGSARVRAGG